MKTILRPLETFAISPRVSIAEGSLIRLIGGGGDLGYRLPGTWRVLRLHRAARDRIYAEVVPTSEGQPGGVYLAFISGPSYRRHGVRWRPYKVRRAAQRSRSAPKPRSRSKRRRASSRAAAGSAMPPCISQFAARSRRRRADRPGT